MTKNTQLCPLIIQQQLNWTIKSNNASDVTFYKSIEKIIQQLKKEKTRNTERRQHHSNKLRRTATYNAERLTTYIDADHHRGRTKQKKKEEKKNIYYTTCKVSRRIQTISLWKCKVFFFSTSIFYGILYASRWLWTITRRERERNTTTDITGKDF